jgi:hypothetical protein
VRPQYPVQPRHPLAVPVAVRHTTNGRASGAENLAYFDATAKDQASGALDGSLDHVIAELTTLDLPPTLRGALIQLLVANPAS